MIIERKDEHIKIALSEDVEVGSTLLDEVTIIHNALPEINIDEVDISVEIFRKKLNAPLIVGALTGGTRLSAKINDVLSRIVEKFCIGMYVGSQRVGIERPETRWTFEVVKKNAPNALKIANLGAPQIAKLDEKKLIDWCLDAVNMINADALSIHLNPAQEVFQPEGEPQFRDVLSKIKYIVKNIDVPVIVKEVGSGISKEVAEKLSQIGVQGLDVAGYGGTSFILIESIRNNVLREVAKNFKSWGIPTAVSICEVREVFQGIVIASGGIRSGLDGVKALTLGSNVFSMSRPFLIHALKGLEEVESFVQKVINEVKIAMFLSGTRKIEELWKVPIVLGKNLLSWIIQRKLRKILIRIGIRDQEVQQTF